jgi:uncharacterized iron-regulated protein
VTSALLLSLLGAAVIVQAPTPIPAYIPERVYDTRRQAFSDLEQMLADLAKADVVFVGEQHDDPNTHRLEAAILEGLQRRAVSVTVSLEMFDRDAQASLEAYLAGTTTEEDFLKSSRPWPRYATNYRALVEMARVQHWPVIASNVPHKHAADVAKGGLGVLESLQSEERRWIARDVQCPRDSYFKRFSDSMKAHPAPGSEKLSAEDQAASVERYYAAQCLRDETMAEAIAAGFDRDEKRTVVHFNGAFHSDFRMGTAERVRRRLGNRRLVVVSILPVKDLDALRPAGDDLERADYLIYTTK